MEVKGFGPRHSEERHESDIYSITESKAGLTVLIDTVNESGKRSNLKVHFEWVRGFRYLDEGDLLYYWETGAFTIPQHVFQIVSGGWSNGELLQPGVLSVSVAIEVGEWFVATTNGCINVLSDAIPTVEYINA